MADPAGAPGDGGPGARAFVRDRVTVLSCGSLGGYAFWLYAFGSALAFLRAELHFSYVLVVVYSAPWAAGAAAVGVSFAWAAAGPGGARCRGGRYSGPSAVAVLLVAGTQFR